MNLAGDLMRFIQRQKRRDAINLSRPFVAVLSQYSEDELLAFDKAYMACKYNGARDNYDGLGRNAKDNNTLFLYLWAAY